MLNIVHKEKIYRGKNTLWNNAPLCKDLTMKYEIRRKNGQIYMRVQYKKEGYIS